MDAMAIPDSSVARLRLVSEDHEFIAHICKVLDAKMRGQGLEETLGMRAAPLIRPCLRQHFWARAVDAMEWILQCGRNNMPYDEDTNNEIPILCRYYNEHLGRGSRTPDEHTLMTVLNEYNAIKGAGHGNFACCRAPGST